MIHRRVLAPVVTARRSNKACHQGAPRHLSFLPLIHVSFSFRRSKQKQQNNGFSDSPRKSVVIEQFPFSSHDNSQAPEIRSSRSPEPPHKSDLSDNNPDLDNIDNAIVDNSPPLVLTQSTIETLNSMTTEEIQKDDEKEHSKGFVISFGPETSVKPKPVLKPRQSSITKLDKELSSLGSSGTSSPVTRRPSSLGSSKDTSQLSLKSQSPKDCDNRVTPSPSMCLVCQVRQIDASVPGGKTCSLCTEMLIKTNGDQSQESSEGNLVTGESRELICPHFRSECVIGIFNAILHCVKLKYFQFVMELSAASMKVPLTPGVLFAGGRLQRWLVLSGRCQAVRRTVRGRGTGWS